ncbi:hypothetical protein D3C87_1635330 [compost metagenome]
MNGLGLRREGVQPGLFKLPTTPVIDTQASGDGRQIRTFVGFAVEHLRALEHTDEGVMGQVGSIKRVVQTPAQQRVQPAVMRGVEGLDAGGIGNRHRERMSMGGSRPCVNKN